MQNVAISFLDQVLTPKHIEELKESSLGLELTKHGQLFHYEEEIFTDEIVTLEHFITMYAKAYSKNEARQAMQDMNNKLNEVKSSFESHFELHKNKVFACGGVDLAI